MCSWFRLDQAPLDAGEVLWQQRYFAVGKQSTKTDAMVTTRWFVLAKNFLSRNSLTGDG